MMMWALALLTLVVSSIDKNSCENDDCAIPYMDQDLYDAAPFISLSAQPPSTERPIWWALEFYEAYYTVHHPIKQHIPHIDPQYSISAKCFQQHFRQHGQPVVMHGNSLRHFGYRTRAWSFEELQHLFPVNNNNTTVMYKANALLVNGSETWDLGPGLNQILKGAPLQRKQDGSRNFPRNSFFKPEGVLQALEIDPPEFLVKEMEDSNQGLPYLLFPSLWFGSNRSDTPLHHDGVDNFLVMLAGTKNVTLVPPTEWHVLSPECNDGGLCHAQTVTDPTNPEASKFNLTMMHVELKAGEILFLPAGWFHFVHNLGPTVMVNHWTHGIRALGLINAWEDREQVCLV